MTQNPYAQFGSDGGRSPYGPDYSDQPQPRTSILAIVALVLSIVGCFPFCFLPGPGGFAVILAGLAILLIGLSNGSRRGIGLAVTALCLGLFQSIVWVVMYVGVNQWAMGWWNTTVTGDVRQMMAALEKGDTKTARSLLTPSGRAVISEEMLADFKRRYNTDAGAFKDIPTGAVDTLRTYFSIGEAMNTSANRQPNAIPIPGLFGKGPALVTLQVDPNMMPRGQQRDPAAHVPIFNLGVATNDGKVVWLLDPDKAKGLFSPRRRSSDLNSPESTIEDAPSMPRVPAKAPGPPKP